MAPEVLSCYRKNPLPINYNIDIYSLGYVLVKMICLENILDEDKTNKIIDLYYQPDKEEEIIQLEWSKLNENGKNRFINYMNMDQLLNDSQFQEYTRLIKKNQLYQAVQYSQSILDDKTIETEPGKWNNKYNLLDFYIDCVNKPNLRLSVEELLHKYFSID